jgi:hypothetical protein
VVRESWQVIVRLEEFYLRTGDPRYLAPVPRCLDWFDRINRESAQQKYPIPRYWEPGTNRPLYVVRTDGRTPEGYGVYKWVTDPSQTKCENGPCKGDGKPIVNVAKLRADYKEIAAVTTPAERASRLAELHARAGMPRRTGNDLAKILSSMDARGAWVTDVLSVPQVPKARAMEDNRATVRGISTEVFADNLSALIAFLRTS